MAQRGNLKKVLFALDDRERAIKILVLRLAVIFNHARRPVELPRHAIRFNRAIEISIDGAWLGRHPLTQYLLDEEAGHWSRVGFSVAVRAL